ncbi:suppressor of Mek1-like [Procambarus clarkii]|uniref:suppressor of Mek1-like n=1 Tax=Procambarus clarkii TaxID=6728 RepID=UPI003743A75E
MVCVSERLQDPSKVRRTSGCNSVNLVVTQSIKAVYGMLSDIDDEERLTTIDSRNHLCNNGQDPAADLSYTRNRMRQDRAQEDKQRDMDIQTTNNSRVVKTPDHKNPQKQLQEVVATQDQRNHSTQETDNKLKSVNHHLAKSQVQTGLVSDKFKKLFTNDEERLTTIDSRNHLCNNGQDPAADLSYTRNRMRQDRAQEDKQRDMDIQTTNNSRVVKTPDHKNPQKQLQEVVATQDQRNHSTQETDNKLKSVNHHLAKSQVQTGLVTDKFKKLFTNDEERLTTIDSRNHLCNNGQDPAADLSYTRNRMRQDRAQEDKQRDMDIQTTNNSRVVKTPDHKNPQKQLQEVVATQDQRNHSTQETDNKLKSVNHHLAKSQVQTGLVTDKFKKLFTNSRTATETFQQEHIRDNIHLTTNVIALMQRFKSQGRRVLINLVPSHVRLIGKDIVHKVSELATKRRNIDIYISQSPSRFK